MDDEAMSDEAPEYPWKLEVLGEYCYYYETEEEALEGKRGIVNNLASCIASACPSTKLTFAEVAAKFDKDVTISNLWESS